MPAYWNGEGEATLKPRPLPGSNAALQPTAMSHLMPPQLQALDTPDQHGTFIRMQWRSLAAFAWEKYQSEGRGAIVVDLRHATVEESRINVPTVYVAEGGKRLAQRGGWPNEEVAEVIRDYDPAQDVVFIFLRLDGDVFHYNVTDELTPPQAYEARRALQPPASSSK